MLNAPLENSTFVKGIRTKAFFAFLEALILWSALPPKRMS